MRKRKTKRVYIAKFKVAPYGDVFFKVGVSTEPGRRVRHFTRDVNNFLRLTYKIEAHSLKYFEVSSDEEAYQLETNIKNTFSSARMFQYSLSEGFCGATECFFTSHYRYAEAYLSSGDLRDLVFVTPYTSEGINKRNLFSAANTGLQWGATRVAANCEQNK